MRSSGIKKKCHPSFYTHPSHQSPSEQGSSPGELNLSQTIDGTHTVNTWWVTSQAAEIPELLEALMSNFSCCGTLLTTVSNFAQADVSVKNSLQFKWPSVCQVYRWRQSTSAEPSTSTDSTLSDPDFENINSLKKKINSEKQMISLCSPLLFNVAALATLNGRLSVASWAELSQKKQKRTQQLILQHTKED